MYLRSFFALSLLGLASAAPSPGTVTKTITSTKTTTKHSNTTKTTTKTSTRFSTVSICSSTAFEDFASTSPNLVPTAPPSNSASVPRTSSTNLVPTAPPSNSASSTRSTTSMSSSSTTSARSTSSSPSVSASMSSSTSTRKTTTSTSPLPTATGTRSGKIALAWANKERDSIGNFVNKNVSMVYTWSPFCPPQAKSLGLLCCPMLWGPQKLSQFQSTVVPGYSSCVAGFNEPMVSGQSNMTPSVAADLWMSAIHPLTTQGYTTVISPAILTSTSGINWMKSFVQLCPQCYKDIDIIAVHTYNINSTKAIANYNTIHNLYPDKKMAITEFACQSYYSGDPYENCSVAQSQAFMLDIMKFVKKTPWMVWAAYFGMFKADEIVRTGVGAANAMIGDDNTPNALGRAYLSS